MLSADAQKRLPALIPRRKENQRPRNDDAPKTPVLAGRPDLNGISPQRPSRRILSRSDHELFLESSTHSLVVGFVFRVAESCKGTAISEVKQAVLSDGVKTVLAILASLDTVLAENPPQDQGASRFGNPAFRSFVDTLEKRAEELHEPFNLKTSGWLIEPITYFENAFGSRERIDYGSGHELNFMMWLLCLERLQCLAKTDFQALALVVLPKYVTLMRRIQEAYYLEPAGSHGVWGLDDYHFIPFLFGASQLIHHPYLTPKAIHNELMIEEGSPEYMYLDMVRYTVASKTVKGLKWTQPMLDDISGSKNWEKVEHGLRRMFLKEILGKLPIMQHFLFGSLIPAEPGMGTQSPQADEEEHTHHGPGHVHHDHEWGDPCGIKIPSTVAAMSEERKHEKVQALRPIPFD